MNDNRIFSNRDLKSLIIPLNLTFGTVQIAANAVANNLDSLGIIPAQALSLAMITVVGRCVGTYDFDQTRYYAKKLIKIAYALTIILNSVILILLPLILRIYNFSPETIRLALILVIIHDGIAILFIMFV